MNIRRIFGKGLISTDMAENNSSEGHCESASEFQIFLSKPGPYDKKHVRLDLIFASEDHFLIEVQAIIIVNGGFFIKNVATMVGGNQNKHSKKNQHWAIQCIKYISLFEDALPHLFSYKEGADPGPSMAWKYSTRIGDETAIGAENYKTAIFFERIVKYLINSEILNKSFVIFVSNDFPTISTSTEDPDEN